MLIFFKNNTTCSFSKNKTITVFVKWSRCCFRVIISCRKSHQGIKASYTTGCNSSF